MNDTYQRADRVSDVIKREVSEILLREIKDPRLDFVTITHVHVSRDLKSARIYFTTIKQGEELEAIRKGLKSASGFIQRKMGAHIHLRYTPHITFIHDSSLESSTRMDKILHDIESELIKNP